MEADGDPQTGEKVGEPEDDEVAPAQSVRPRLPDGQAEEREGYAGDEAGDEPIEPLVIHWLYGVGGRSVGAVSWWFRLLDHLWLGTWPWAGSQATSHNRAEPKDRRRPLSRSVPLPRA